MNKNISKESDLQKQEKQAKIIIHLWKKKKKKRFLMKYFRLKNFFDSKSIDLSKDILLIVLIHVIILPIITLYNNSPDLNKFFFSFISFFNSLSYIVHVFIININFF